MTTLDQWFADHPAVYELGDGYADRQIEEIKATEALIRSRDPLGAIRVIGSHPRIYNLRGDEGSGQVHYDLPVLEAALPKVGLRICGADHGLSGWGITVESEMPVYRLDDTDMDTSYLRQQHFSGFAAARAPVHGHYGFNYRRFSFHFMTLRGFSVAIKRVLACL